LSTLSNGPQELFRPHPTELFEHDNSLEPALPPCASITCFGGPGCTGHPFVYQLAGQAFVETHCVPSTGSGAEFVTVPRWPWPHELCKVHGGDDLDQAAEEGVRTEVQQEPTTGQAQVLDINTSAHQTLSTTLSL
jgi:hypothetical protein